MSKARDLADLGAVTDRLDTVGASDGALSNRNLIINGAMQVAQRGTSSQTTGQSSNFETVDRFRNYSSAYSTLVVTQSQSGDAPAGFNNSFKASIDTSETAPANGFMDFRYKTEAQDMHSLAYGTTSAKEMTLSFWVKSNVTGTYNITFYMDDAAKVYNVPYTVDATDTWEYKTVQVSGNSSSGQVFNNDNGVGLYVSFTLSAGANYKGNPSTDAWGAYSSQTWGGGQVADVAGTAGNYWQITGVQLEVGDTATPFEHRSYGDELARCQRYCVVDTHNAVSGGSFVGYWSGSTFAEGHRFLPVEMRAVPTISVPTIGSVYALIPQTSWVQASAFGQNESTTQLVKCTFTCSSNGSYNTASRNGTMLALRASGSIVFDSEL
jgi:hypothetical protein